MKISNLLGLGFATSIALGALTATNLGCYAHGSASVEAPEVEVRIPPPAVRVEVASTAPGPEYVWVPGYWDWNGNAYVWVNGQYVLADEGYVWVGPRYVVRGGARVYVRGYWWHSHRHVKVYGHQRFHRAPRRR